MMQGLPILQLGARVAEVGNWQRFLNEQAITDREGKPLRDDEDFGRRTAEATMRYQEREYPGSKVSGVVDQLTRKRAASQGFVPFIQAANYTRVHPARRTVSLIVLHTMECLEKADAAENVAIWFANRVPKYPAPKASAHYCIDEDSEVQCVRDMDVAWHANQANTRSIGIEHAGFARQTKEQWADVPSRMILWRSARRVARLCRNHGIPLTKLTPDEVVSGKPGLCGHADVTRAYRTKGGHMDPGLNFPWEHFLALTSTAL